MLYLFAAILLIAIISFFISKRDKKNVVEKENKNVVSSDCCGAHEICESETLLNSKIDIAYFDDEELDRFAEVSRDSFTDIQIEEFREILYSLQEHEVSDWLKSLQLRRVTIPDIIREEALMIVSERRYQNERIK